MEAHGTDRHRAGGGWRSTRFVDPFGGPPTARIQRPGPAVRRSGGPAAAPRTVPTGWLAVVTVLVRARPARPGSATERAGVPTGIAPKAVGSPSAPNVARYSSRFHPGVRVGGHNQGEGQRDRRASRIHAYVGPAHRVGPDTASSVPSHPRRYDAPTTLTWRRWNRPGDCHPPAGRLVPTPIGFGPPPVLGRGAMDRSGPGSPAPRRPRSAFGAGAGADAGGGSTGVTGARTAA